MFCLICGKFSFEIICKECQNSLLKPNIQKKDDIVSFYPYDEIESLIKYKYHPFGSRIFEILAKNSFKYFSENYKEKIYSISIDDKVKKGYSHTAILNHSLKSKYITPLYKKLMAQNNINYAGKDLQFRLKNPRNFKYSGQKNIDVILVDDIVTTGSTLNEAKQTLQQYGVNVIFSLVLADKRW